MKKRQVKCLGKDIYTLSDLRESNEELSKVCFENLLKNPKLIDMRSHINKSNRALKPEFAKYLAAVRSMEKYFLGFSIRSFPRSQNKQSDQLAKATAQLDPLPPDVFFATLKQASVNCAEEPAKLINAITSEDWRATIMAYLRGHFVPEDEKEEKRMALALGITESSAKNYTEGGGLCATSKMYFARRRQEVTLRNTCRDVLLAHRNEGSSRQSFP